MTAAPLLLPILPVRDLEEAVAWWSRLPGLTVEAYAGGGYAFVRLDGAEVAHLGEFPDLDPARNRSGCYVHVPDVDGLHARCRDVGLAAPAPRDEPWGMREFRLIDPSGNYLRVGTTVGVDQVRRPDLGKGLLRLDSNQ